MRLLSVLDRYLTQLQADGRSPFWQDQVKRHVQSLDRWLAAHHRSRDLGRITHETLADFLASPEANTRRDGRPKKATSTNALRSSLRTFCRFAFAAGYAPRDAAALVRRARCASPPPRALPEADCKRLLATLAKAKGPRAERDHLLFRLLLETGVRIGSALAIDVRDVDLRAGELTLTTMKNDRPNRVSIPKSLRPQLRAAVAGRTEGWLFEGRPGRPLCGRHARKRLEFWLHRAGLRHASPHALRHSFASGLYARTRDILLVRQALCHQSVGSTAVYVAPSTARRRNSPRFSVEAR